MATRDDEYILYLIEQGALEPYMVDGEFLFQVTDKCKEIDPEFYRIHMESIEEEFDRLVEQGLAIKVYKDGEAHYMPTEKAREYLSDN